MLLFSNLPDNCSELELKTFIQSKGVQPLSVRIIRDVATGMSPAFGDVELESSFSPELAVTLLHGMRIRNRIVHVRKTTAFRPARRAASM